MRSVVYKVLCFYLAPRGHCSPNPRGVQSALRSIHAPTRNEEGTYIGASVASDLDTLSTLYKPSQQGMMMNRFLWGGWVARPSAFYFCACTGRLVFGVVLVCSVLSHCSDWLQCLTVFNLTALGYLCSSWSRLRVRCALSYTFSLSRLIFPYLNRTLSNVALPVLGMPSISALLDSISNALTIYSSNLTYLFIR